MCKCEYNNIISHSRITLKREMKMKKCKNNNFKNSQKNSVIFTEQSVYRSDDNKIRIKMKDEKIISICMQINEYIKTVNWKSFSFSK